MNQRHVLHDYIELLRMQDGKSRDTETANTCVNALQNCIRTMELARNGVICGEDLHALDLGSIPLNEIHWSAEGEAPTTFRGSRVSLWNLSSGHAWGVRTLAISPDGKQILTGDNYGEGILWDASSGLMVEKLRKYLTPVSAAAFSADGKRCLSGYDHGLLMLWDTANAKLKKRFAILKNCRYANSIISVAIAPDEKHYLIGAKDGFLILDPRTRFRKKIARIPEHVTPGSDTPESDVSEPDSPEFSIPASGIISPDGKKCLIDLGCDEFQLMEMPSGKLIRKLKTPPGRIASTRSILAFSSDSTFCMAAYDKTVLIWSTEGDLCWEKTLEERIALAAAFQDNTSPVSPGCQPPFLLLTITDQQDALELWNTSSGTCIRKLKIDQPYTPGTSATSGGYPWMPKETKPPLAALSADGKCCITADDRYLRIWNTASGEQLRPIRMFKAGVAGCMLSWDETKCLTYSHENAWLWDVPTGKLIRILDDHPAWIWNAYVTKDNTEFRTFCAKEERCWDSQTGELLWKRDAPGTSLPYTASSPDEKYNITFDAHMVELRRSETQELIWSFTRETEPFWYCFSEDNRNCLTVCEDAIILWDNTTGQPLRTIKIDAKRIISRGNSQDLKNAVFFREQEAPLFLDLTSGETFSYELPENEEPLCFQADDGNYILTADWDQNVLIRREVRTGICRGSFHIPRKMRDMILDCYPYCFQQDDIQLKIWKFDLFSPEKHDPVLIGNFYNVFGLHVEGCDFRDFTVQKRANKKTRKRTKEDITHILKQYGAKL